MSAQPEDRSGAPYAREFRRTTQRHERLLQQLSILREIDRFDDFSLDLGHIFRGLLEALAFGLAAENCSLSLVDDSGEYLELRAACSALEERGISYGPGGWRGKRFRLGEGIAGQVAQTGQAVRIEDVAESADFLPVADSRATVRSLLCFPLRIEDKTIGVLNLSHSSPGFFTPEVEMSLGLIADRIARLVRSHLLHRRLRESEEHYRLVTQNAGDVILVFDGDRRILNVNPAVEKIAGIAAREFVSGKADWESLIHPDDRAPFRRQLASVVESNSTGALEYRLIDAGGATHYVEQRCSPFRDSSERRTGVVCIVRDMTDKIMALDALQESLQTSAEIEQAIPSGLFVFRYAEPDSLSLLSANPEAERLTGLQAAEWYGKEVEGIWPGARNEELKKIVLEVMRTGETYKNEELYYAGERIKGFFRIRIFRMASNRLGVAFEDVTERKRAEQEKAELEAQLQQAQKMQAIGTLAGGIAHDFNNILAGILGYAELARDAAPKEGVIRAHLDQVLKAGARAKDLVRQILTFSRQSKAKRRPSAITPIVKETVKLLRATVPATIEMRLNIETENEAVLADPTQVHQLLMNLCTNACQAMLPVGGLLEVSLKTLEAGEHLLKVFPDLRKERYVKLSVRDTGHGMDTETMARIFDPFFTTKRTGEGAGLGLSVAHGIVKSHEGVIAVKSDVGKGSVFDVYLPLIDSQPDAEEEAEKTPPRGSGNILFVDDEEMMVQLGQNMLEGLGYSVTVCSNGVEAFEAFRAAPGKFDLVISDLTMPKMTGLDLARNVMEVRPDMPVILITGYSDALSPEQAGAMGICDYIIKPFTVSELGNGVLRALEKKARRQV